jgi:hypothetical protein
MKAVAEERTGEHGATTPLGSSGLPCHVTSADAAAVLGAVATHRRMVCPSGCSVLHVKWYGPSTSNAIGCIMTQQQLVESATPESNPFIANTKMPSQACQTTDIASCLASGVLQPVQRHLAAIAQRNVDGEQAIRRDILHQVRHANVQQRR